MADQNTKQFLDYEGLKNVVSNTKKMLAEKASKKHNHTISEIDGLNIALESVGTVKTVNGKAPDAQGNVIVDTLMQKENIIKENIIYGFKIDADESDPAAAVTYLADAVGMTPAAMNYQKNIFDYGSWENAFFMPRPCMLKSNGTVDYYLDKNNYAYKEDGVSKSDIANTQYDGNAMMEWGKNGKKIWLKVVPSSREGTGEVYIANYKADSNFKCYSFVGKNNNVNDHFYTPIYNGSNVSSKLRSLSGLTHMVGQSEKTEMNYAQANGNGWNIECLADRMLINFLLVLMGKSLDTQKVFGNGHYSGGSDADSNKKTGLLNSKGLFWGSNGNDGVKVFGMENYWGEVWRRTNGCLNVEGSMKIKLTEGTYDGTTATGYNTSGGGYIDVEACSYADSSYIKTQLFTQYGIFPTNVSGSSTTYYCDGMRWCGSIKVDFALFGGSSANDAVCGAFALASDNIFVSLMNWPCGAALSYKHP